MTTSPPTLTLARFLSDRLDETQTAAKHVLAAGTFPPFSVPVAGHDPAFVLADVKSKRAIVAKWESLSEQADHPIIGAHCTGVGIALRLLAQPYAAHPDFRQEWVTP